MAKELAARAVMDPDLTDQVITPRRALAELDRIRQVSLEVSGRSIKVITKRNALQAQVLAALGVNTASWDKADIA